MGLMGGPPGFGSGGGPCGPVGLGTVPMIVLLYFMSEYCVCATVAGLCVLNIDCVWCVAK